ncbi:hypothetical protein [Azotobacter salinestris]|uniref:hypothetical protein n=1 Tax=Azotobacter salinestris TaxID=69964 RepID=UPI0032DF6AF9
MSDEKAITPFEVGVCSAMTLIGKALAMSPHVDVEGLKADATRAIAAMPEEPKWQGGLGQHQAALASLLQGLELVKR